MDSAEPPERYCPERSFPAYAFVPGQHPHPVTDPDGHSFQQAEESPPLPEPGELTSLPDFRFGVDLFNAGYYWEAHEAWEGIWLACGRKGTVADLLKGLIRLAAAGVKAREGNAQGVTRHAQRAEQLFTQTGNERLTAIARNIASSPPSDPRFTEKGNPVLRVQLRLEDFAEF